MIRIGINGFGRIGRMVFRVAAAQKGVQVVAVNDAFVNAEYMAYLLKYDTVHGRFNGNIELDGTDLMVNGVRVKTFARTNPGEIPWRSCGADYIVESTGVFTGMEKAAAHFMAGAKKVIITAPSADAPMLVMGVNHTDYRSDMNIVSGASCTTNAVAPIIKILNESFGVEECMFTTVHSATNSQKTVDGSSRRDWRGGRAVGNNIIPSDTGAAKSVAKVLPQLAGRVNGISLRVPTMDVSLVDITVRLKQDATYEQILSAVRQAGVDKYRGIVGYTDEPVVSSDFVGEPRTGVLDSRAGLMLSPRFVKLLVWYDNEWGYSNKIVDIIRHMNSVDGI